jgi:hypothetical protein
MKLFIFDMFCALLVAMCNLVYPYITQDIINVYAPNKNLNALIISAIILLFIYILKAILKSLCGSKLTIVDVPGMIFWFGGWYYLLGTALIDYYPFSVNLSCFLFLVPFGLLSGYKRIVEAKKHGDGHLHLTMLPSFLTIFRLFIAMMFIMVKRIDFSSSEILYYIGLYAWFFIPIKFTRKTEDMVLSNLAENKVKVKKKPEVTPMPVPPAPSLLWWRRRRKDKNNMSLDS